MIIVEPSAGISPIVDIIQSAKNELNISASSISSAPILNAILVAAKSGVKVRIISDKIVVAKSGVKKNIRIHERKASSQDSISYYGQYICTLRVCAFGNTGLNRNIVSSINYIYLTKAKSAVKTINHLFTDEWHSVPVSKTVTSWLPVGIAYKNRMLSTISEAGDLFIETNTLGSDHKMLSIMAHKGSSLQMLLPCKSAPYDQSINLQSVAYLQRHGVSIRWSPTVASSVHTTLIIGTSFAYLGNQPLAFHSLANPYIMAALLNGSAEGILHGQFASNWHAARATKDSFNKNSSVLHVVFPHKKSWF
jgi:hypothetical protein